MADQGAGEQRRPTVAGSDPPREPESRGVRLLERQVERKGLRPRFAAAIIAILWMIAIVVFGIVEHLVDPESFGNVWLGLWWATQTVTTVGYGDTVPDQTAGKVIAAVLMIGGLSLFAVITGTITSAFVTRAQARLGRARHEPLEEKVEELSTELAALREQLSRLELERPPARRPPADEG